MLKLVHRQYHHRLIQVADPVQRALFPYVSIIYEKTHKKMDIIRYLTIFESALSILLIATTIGTILIHCILLSIVSK
jgi:MFS-type transporter involved in bile tolerance (Atg22 family)